MANPIRPEDLPPVPSLAANDAFIVDTGAGVYKTTPDEILAAAGGVTTTTLSASPGSSLVGFLQSGAGAVPETTQNALRRIIFAEQYGFGAVGNTPAQNSTAWKNAIAATPTGAILRADASGVMDVTGGLSNAPLIDRQMTIEINGALETNGHAVQANPCYMFKVTADNVVFTGTGTIAGDGSINDANTGSDTTHPGLIYVDTTDGFIFGNDLTIDTPPKVGICLVDCTNARIAGIGIGGPTAYDPGIGEGPAGANAAHTAYFYVLATGGSGHTFTLSARRDGSGGRAVNAIFGSGTQGDCPSCIVRGGTFDVWEKACYLWGANHLVESIEVVGVMTDGVRFMRGTNCTARGVIVTAGRGGVAGYDCPGLVIERCQIKGVTQIAITIGQYDTTTPYAGGFSGITIRDNICEGSNTSNATFTASIASDVLDLTVLTNGAVEAGQIVSGGTVALNTVILNQISGTAGGVGTYRVSVSQTVASTPALTSNMLADGIRVNAPSANSQNITISGNQVSNFAPYNGYALLRVDTSGFTITRSRIFNNQLTDCPQSALILRAVQNSVIEANKFGGLGTYFAVVSTSGNNLFLNNVALDNLTPSVGINGIDATDRGRGNRYNLTPLDGTTTLTANATVTVTHGGVAPNARIKLASNSNAFGTMIVAKGWPRTGVSGTNFTVTSANATAFAGTESLEYEILQ